MKPRTGSLMALVVLTAGMLGGCAGTGGKDEAQKQIPAKESIRMARATMTGGDARSAIGFYEQALKVHPDDYAATLGMADALYLTGEIVAADGSYARAAELDPKAIDPILARARIATRQRRLDEAWSLYSRADAVAGGSDPRPPAGQGVINDLRGKPEAAQDCYRRALAIRPDDLSARNNLGLSLALSGRPRQAIDVLLAIVQNPASPPQARHNLALAYGLLGNAVAAENVLSTDLDAGSVQNNLHYYVMLRRRLAEPHSQETATP